MNKQVIKAALDSLLEQRSSLDVDKNTDGKLIEQAYKELEMKTTKLNSIYDEKTRRILESVKTYIEDMEVKVDWEWGSCRELEEIKEDGDMPDLYDDVTELLQNVEEPESRPDRTDNQR